MKAAGTEPASAEDPELEKAVCRCVKDILPTRKSEYADILQRVDLDEAAVTDVAKSENITPNNATVQLHRARKALQGRHIQTCSTCTKYGCLECHCRHKEVSAQVSSYSHPFVKPARRSPVTR